MRRDNEPAPLDLNVQTSTFFRRIAIVSCQGGQRGEGNAGGSGLKERGA
jgi:hypothetical protein